MKRMPLFAQLVVDEHGQPVETSWVGDEPCYVVNDAGFRRHIPSDAVDKQVLQALQSQVAGMEDELSKQAAQMLGQDDIFTVAMLKQQFANMEQHFDEILQTGLPEEVRAYMGMLGFRIVIDIHGDVLEIEQPSQPGEE